jgi:TonB family protein
MKNRSILICLVFALMSIEAYSGDGCDFSKYKPLRGSFEGKLTRKTVKPEYPVEARTKRIQGTVAVQVLCDANGTVIKACATSGDPALRKAAEEGAMKTLFKPFFLNGKKVRYVQHTISFQFVLSDKK